MIKCEVRDGEHQNSTNSLSIFERNNIFPTKHMEKQVSQPEKTKRPYSPQTNRIVRSIIAKAKESRTFTKDPYDTNSFRNNSNRKDLSTMQPNRTLVDIVDKRGKIERKERDYLNRSDNCGKSFADRSCPSPTMEEMKQIGIVCEVTELQMDTIVSLSMIFGLPGSVLALVTVSSMTVSPPTVYMGCLAVSDFISLLFGVQVYKLPDDGTFTYLEVVAIFWFGRIFQAFSHWTLSLMCLERFVSVKFPTQKSRIYTKKNTWLSVGVAFIISTIPFDASCLHYMKYEYNVDVVLYLSVLHNLIYIIFPGAMVVTFSTLTAVQIKRGARRRADMMSAQASSRPSRMEADLTRMMFLTSVCFVIFTCPWAAVHTFDRVRTLFCPFGEAVFSFFFYGCLSVTFFNHAINFYVYYACARGFRNQFWQVICCKK